MARTSNATDIDVVQDSAGWHRLKAAVTAFRPLQAQDGSVEDTATALPLVESIRAELPFFADLFPHDAEYLRALDADFARWADEGFGVPDFLDSLQAFQPQQHRIDGLRHLVVFPMYTQNGSRDRHVEALLAEVIWPEFIEQLEAGDYSNKLFVPL